VGEKRQGSVQPGSKQVRSPSLKERMEGKGGAVDVWLPRSELRSAMARCLLLLTSDLSGHRFLVYFFSAFHLTDVVLWPSIGLSWRMTPVH
jgi:hypothetical protein